MLQARGRLREPWVAKQGPARQTEQKRKCEKGAENCRQSTGPTEKARPSAD